MTRPSLIESIQDRNRQTSGNWSSFQSHREHLKTLIAENAPPNASSICVLGAGNLNDVDLPWLMQRFPRIVLVDIDVAATQQGVMSQLGNSVAVGVELQQVDVTGVFDLLTRIVVAGAPCSDAMYAEIVMRLQSTPAVAAIGEKFDCVVSACLLSQLIDGMKSAVGESDSRFLQLVQQVRAQHLQTIEQLAAEAGTMLLVIDFVSSVTSPQLRDLPPAELSNYAAEQLRRRNFFTGLNPTIVATTMATVLQSAGRQQRSVLSPPWKWDLGPRIYLVVGVIARLV